MNRIVRQKRHSRRGIAMVEMALVMPVFFLVVLGIIEFGRAMMVSNMVTSAAREGARMAVVDGSTNTDVTNAINTFLHQSTGVSTSNISTTITVVPATGNADPSNQVANSHTRDLITVKVQIPFNSVALLKGNYLAGKKLVGQSAMRHE